MSKARRLVRMIIVGDIPMSDGLALRAIGSAETNDHRDLLLGGECLVDLYHLAISSQRDFVPRRVSAL